MIKESVIQSVRNLDIADIVKPYVKLKRQGSRLVGSCPLHSEKTPSFSISPASNLFYCFGCKRGGDGIDFIRYTENMDFIEAVKHIASHHGISIEEDEGKSPEEIKESKHRESLLVTMEKVHSFFEYNLRVEMNDDSRQAREYCYGRWPDDFCSTASIGYAPKESQPFIDFCKINALDQDCLMELGLLKKADNGDVYAGFRERIMIPIKDRFGRIIAYTGRYIGHIKKMPKYINSPNNPIYVKGHTLFGIDRAFRFRESKLLNIVEGAPDVLRLQSIGLENTVASLGTAWSDKQFDLIRKKADTLCFLPDADVPNGTSFGPGVDAVITNGSEAIRRGFNVTVRELSCGAREKTSEELAEEYPDGVIEDDASLTIPVKADADSTIHSQSDYYAIKEELFLPWLLKKRLRRNYTLEDERKVTEEIAGLLIFVKDQLIFSRCIEEISSIHGRKQKYWKDAVSYARGMARKDRRSLEAMDAEQKEAELLRRCGLFTRDNCYFYLGDDEEEPVFISNFIMEPLYHITDDTNGSRIFRLKNETGGERLIEMKESDMCSLPCFQQRTGSAGNFVWVGKADKLNRLKRFLYARTDTAERIRKLGWNDTEDFFAFGNGIFYRERFLPVDELGIVRAGNGRAFYIPATSQMFIHNREIYQFERLLVHSTRNAMSMREFASQLSVVFGSNARIAFCYLLSTIFRDVVFGVTRHFPILNLFGEKGTGKTTLATCLQSFFLHGVDPPNLGVTSIPAMNDRVSQAVNTLVVLDEYKNDLDIKKISYLKGLWGGGGQTKKSTVSDGVAVQTIVSTGVVLCGQDKPTQDMALFTRVLFLSFSKTSFNQLERNSYAELVSLCQTGMTHLTLEVLRFREHFEKNFKSHYNTVKSDMAVKTQGEEFHERIFGNWLIPLATFRTLETVLDLPFSYAELMETALAGLRTQNELAQESSEVGDFWSNLQGLQTAGKIVDGVHFKIHHLDKFRPLGSNDEYDFGRLKPILYLNMAAISSVFSGRNNNCTANRSNWSTLTAYVKAHHSFLGLKQDRFSILTPSGVPDYIVETIDGKQVKHLRVNRPKAMCFDYQSLKENFGLDLETEVVTDDNDSGGLRYD